MKGWKIFIFVMVAWFVGLIMGAVIRNVEMQQRAVNHGAAIYNPTNGSFQWKQ